MAFFDALLARGMRHPLALLLAQNTVQPDGEVSMTAPLRLKSYTVAGLPSAALWQTGIVYVSNGTSNKRLAVSDGTNWRWPDGAIVT